MDFVSTGDAPKAIGPDSPGTNAGGVILSAGDAPKAIGPYRQGTSAGGFIFTAGQVALDPKTGEVVPGGIKEQTERVMQNLPAILQAAGSGITHPAKTTVLR